jgi:hypothetical protein
VRWILSLLAALSAATALPQTIDDREKADGFVPLFNGKDLDGWHCHDGKDAVWKVEDDLLVCSGAGGGWLGTTKTYSDFIVRLEYRLQPGGNSGVYLRAPDTGHISRVGMEVQILDDDHPSYKKIDYYQYCGSLYHLVAPTRRMTKPAGQWNAMEIRAEGRRVVVVLNGVKIVDADLDRLRQDEAVAREHPGLARTSGRIGLQSHSERVEFRRLRVKELKPATP